MAFITGSARVPIGGLKLEIVRAAEADKASHTAADPSASAAAAASAEISVDQMLPRSHTCFNQLILPPYTNPRSLADRLKLAVDEALASGFMLT